MAPRSFLLVLHAQRRRMQMPRRMRRFMLKEQTLGRAGVGCNLYEMNLAWHGSKASPQYVKIIQKQGKSNFFRKNKTPKIVHFFKISSTLQSRVSYDIMLTCLCCPFEERNGVVQVVQKWDEIMYKTENEPVGT